MKKNLKSEEMVISILEPVKNAISLILVEVVIEGIDEVDVNPVMLNILRKNLSTEPVATKT